jgi:hypothetical protein
LSGSATFDSDYDPTTGEVSIDWEVSEVETMYRWRYALTNISFGGDGGVSGLALSFGVEPYTGEMESIVQPNGWSAKRYLCSGQNETCEWPNDIEWFILGAGIEASPTSMEQTAFLQTMALQNGTADTGIFEFLTKPREPTDILFLAFSGWAGAEPPDQAGSISDLVFAETGFAFPTGLPGPGRLLPETGGIPEPGSLSLVAPALIAAGFLAIGRRRKRCGSDREL